jgi:hypothetical protein
MSNEAIAQQFLELADLTDFVGDSPFKSRAYRQAAQVLESLQTPIETLAENGVDALAALPGIGERHRRENPRLPADGHNPQARGVAPEGSRRRAGGDGGAWHRREDGALAVRATRRA